MAIRFNAELRQQIDDTLRRYNAKISRLQRKEEEFILPEKLNFYDIVGNYKTRKDLNEKLKELQRFSKRGVEETITTKGGVDISRYEMENIRLETKRVKQRLTREINKLEKITPTSLGVKQDFTLKTLPSDRLVNLRARRKSLEKDINLLQGEDFQYYVQKIQSNKRRSRYRDLQYQESYIDKMLTKTGYMIGFDAYMLKEIRDKLKTLSTEEFLRFMDTEKLVKEIQNDYDETQTRIKKNRIITQNSINEMYNKFEMLYNNIDKMLKNYK